MRYDCRNRGGTFSGGSQDSNWLVDASGLQVQTGVDIGSLDGAFLINHPDGSLGGNHFGIWLVTWGDLRFDKWKVDSFYQTSSDSASLGQPAECAWKHTHENSCDRCQVLWPVWFYFFSWLLAGNYYMVTLWWCLTYMLFYLLVTCPPFTLLTWLLESQWLIHVHFLQ